MSLCALPRGGRLLRHADTEVRPARYQQPRGGRQPRLLRHFAWLTAESVRGACRGVGGQSVKYLVDEGVLAYLREHALYRHEA